MHIQINFKAMLLDKFLPCLICTILFTPWIIAIIYSNQLMYVNAWDEETYLTYQAGWGLLNRVGYTLDGLVIILFQELGFSGAETNFIFDLIVTPMTVLTMAITISRLGVSTKYPVALAFLILFSSTLFNQANPLISHADEYFGGIVFSGKEGYSSALRTPQPQLSLLIVSVAVFFYSKYKKKWFLYAPIPLLYPFFGVVYFITVTTFLSVNSKLYNALKLKWLLIVIFTITFVVGLFLYLIDIGGILNSFKIASPGHFNYTRAPHLPTLLILISPIIFFAYLINLKKRHSVMLDLIVAICMCIFCIANLQLISGYTVSYKNFYDYGINFLGGILLILLYKFFEEQGNRLIAFNLLFLSLTLVSLLNLPWHWLKFSEYRVWLSSQSMPLADRELVKQFPFNGYIPDSNLRGKFAYSVNKGIAPIFSYQYNFPDFGKTCPQIYDRMRELLSNNTQMSLQLGLNKTDNYLSNEMWRREGVSRRVFMDQNLCLNQSLTGELWFVKLSDGDSSWFRFSW